MADVVTFDPVNLRIVEISTGGDNELDLVEVYSEWKVWVKDGDNAKHPPAFRFVGGDPISGVQSLGTTYFLINGWRIRPAELNHKLTVVGNLFTDPAGFSAYVPTLGSFQVNTETRVSNLTDSSVARLDLAQLLQEVYVDPSGVSGTTAGTGTPTNPVNNLVDARTIADNENLRGYAITGTYTVNADHEDWTFRGTSGIFNNLLTLGGVSVDGSRFEDLVILGTMTGEVDVRGCLLSLLTGLNGAFRLCGLNDSVTLASASRVVMANCFSTVPGNNRPTMTFSGANDVSIRNYSGGITLAGVTAGATASIDLSQGTLELDASCTGGSVLVRGSGLLIDNSTGTTVNHDGFLHADDIDVMVQSTIGNADIAVDDLTVTILDPALATLRQLSLSADGRTRRVL
jgi:hypothetical protein